MSDETTELLRRQAVNNPDAAIKLQNRENRIGEGRLFRLRQYVGHWVYIEGARMNYYGLLLEVTNTHTGDPAELLLHPCYRVGEWNEEGPVMRYTQLWPGSEEHPSWIPWQAVDHFTLAPEVWRGTIET